MKCEKCEIEHSGSYGSGRFCGSSCSRSFATANKRDAINEAVSKKMAGRSLSGEHKKKILDANIANGRACKRRTIKNCNNCSKEMHCLPSNRSKFCSLSCWVTYTEKNKDPMKLYRERCLFTFATSDYPDKFDLSLVEKYGWYSPSNKGNNLKGVSRDHMFSVKAGFDNGIDPAIISHPANCELLIHTENQSKREKSSITLEELIDRINKW